MPVEQRVPGEGTGPGQTIEQLAGVIGGADSKVELNEPGQEKLVGVKAVDAEVGVDLAGVRQGAAGGEESGEGGGARGDAAVG